MVSSIPNFLSYNEIFCNTQKQNTMLEHLQNDKLKTDFPTKYFEKPLKKIVVVSWYW